MDLLEKYGAQLIPAFIGLTGLVIGLFWNQFFAWRKNKREQKAKLNYLLFNLLELYHFFSRNNITEPIKMYISKLEEKLGAIPDHERPQVEAFLIATIKERVEEINDDEIDQLSEHYEKAVKEVAQINPFLAYRLSGQSKKLENLDAFHDYLDSFQEMLTTNSDRQILEAIRTEFSGDRFFTDAVEDIKDSILEVSREISILKQMESKRFFKEKEKQLKEEYDKEIGKVVDRITTLINP